MQAVKEYVNKAGDWGILTEEVKPGCALRDVLCSIMNHYQNGTSYEHRGTERRIYMDPADSLIVSPAQATWMDAWPQGLDRPVTARDGKCVEINALWYANLRFMAEIDPAGAQDYHQRAEWVRESFRCKFWNPATGVLYDFIDGLKILAVMPSGRICSLP